MKEKELELTIDYEKILGFVRSRYPYLILLGVFLLSLYIRLPPIRHPTLLAMDPFHHYRKVKILLENPNMKWDTKRIYPPGTTISWNLLHYLTAYSYKFTSIFIDIDLLTFCKWFPAFLGALVVIPMFFLVKYLYNEKAALFSSFFIGTSPFYIQKTMAGFFDTDLVTVLIPLTAFVFYFYALKSKDWKFVLSSLLSGLFLGLFAWTWGGAWYSFYYILGFALVYLAYHFLINREIKKFFRENKKFLAITTIVLVFGTLIGMHFQGHKFIDWPLRPFRFEPKREKGEYFPNVYVSVSEMQTPSLNTIFNRLGIVGPLALFGLAFLGYEWYKGKRNEEVLMFSLVMALSGFYASTVAVRFIKFLILPCVILAGIGFIPVLEWVKAEKDRTKLLWKVGLALVIITPLLWIPTNRAHKISSMSAPSMTKNWLDAFEWIKNNTDPCSLIVTYWDPGHAINAIADRATVFGGASQNTKRTITLEGDLNEEEIEEIALVNEYVVERFEKDGKVYTNLTTARIQDIATTLYTDNETIALKILERYEPECGEMYYLATSDLLGKSYWWSYFSTWTKERGEGEPSNYVMLRRDQRRIIDGKLTYIYLFGQGAFLIQRENDTFVPYIWAQGQQRIHRIYYFERGVGKFNEFEGEGGTVWLAPDFSYLIYMPPQLENSMFTKMFFWPDKLRHFELVRNFGGEVKLYKIYLQ